MNDLIRPLTVLVADDDSDDRLLMRDAFQETRLTSQLHFVQDGEELMDYLFRRGKYANPLDSPSPGLILLDLNMPKKDGREALKEIKGHPLLRLIPVVVLTTSRAEEDVHRSYELGVNSFITKPVNFETFIEIIRTLTKYWFEVVQLPKEVRGEQR
jgi:CheY-like chemotaxis protein